MNKINNQEPLKISPSGANPLLVGGGLALLGEEEGLEAGHVGLEFCLLEGQPHAW
jgi:hypothetical protein